ncbi:RNA polymerase sigma factor [Thermoactinospora rubra]|uniref:RNA polymerase sigma factor n=1 Tax=Thermoactinospora rubra TaxID=1088767 RepID=UPI000A110D46|nr:sigma-70 family RNA polymerase sigma factor [Thermoactinospora rubra]
MDHEAIGRLFRAAAAGDAAAWKSFVEALSPLVWSVVRAHGLPEADAGEVYQTTWFRLAQNLGRIREPEKVSTWLATTARNEALKAIRARRRLVPGDEDAFERVADERTPEAAVIEAEEEAAAAERDRRLWQAFQELGAKCRRLLRILIGSPPHSYQEAAAALGLSVGSIGPMRQRCLRQLRLLLAERGMG